MREVLRQLLPHLCAVALQGAGRHRDQERSPWCGRGQAARLLHQQAVEGVLGRQEQRFRPGRAPGGTLTFLLSLLSL